jgi:signal transduction histidine kinase/DNA-binding NarL/FixJ family response regulator
MLTGQLAFTGNSLVDVVQNVLGKKLPPLSTKRMDVPDALSAVVQKMTQKEVAERYHTISSVKGDLKQISKLLCDGESEALKQFQIAQRDVSSFFTLPSGMFGRKEEHDKVVSVAERVYRRQHLASTKSAAQINPNGVYIGSGSSMSDGRVDSFELGEGSSDSGSFNINSRSNSNTGPYLLGHVSTHDSSHSTESSISTQRPPLFQSKVKISADSRVASENTDRESYISTGASNQSHMDSLSSLARHKTNQKLRRSGRCEVITISGIAGLGKTDLIQRVQPAIRKFGYIATAKLDRARRVPFEAFAKVLASLLRQIFSEREVNSEYHNTIRSALRPVWPTLHRVLELPEQLISPGSKESSSSPKLYVAQHLLKEGSKGEATKRVGHSSLGHGQEFFLSGGSFRNMRLMEIYVEILRTLCHHKLICVCLDDLQYADDETSDLVMSVLKARIPCLLILAARKDELESADIRAIFDADSQNVTNIILKPLSEEETGNYVAATMHQPPNLLLRPLVVIIQERSCGNPFFIRMMLDTCYRKNCIWYSWRHSSWEYDLDRVFTEFIAPMYGTVFLGSDFIAKRLREIPSEARAIIAWASFLGSPFSFSLVKKLVSGEFFFVSGEEDENDVTCPNATKLVQSEADIVVGLQYLVQTYVLLPGETDDEFRFAYDRFAHVSTGMRECHNIEKMHFIIALTMIKYCPDDRDLYAKARHICEASQLIKIRISNRSEHRKALREAAQLAAQSGARPTALFYFQHCLGLLQDSPWDESLPDVNHFETGQLYIETAEMLWSQSQSKDALELLAEFLKHISTAACRSKAWILKSKIHAQTGNHHDAMDSLLTSLEELGVQLREPILYEQCDAAYDKLRAYLKSVDFEAEMLRPISEDSNVIAIGNVVAEAVSVSFWGDSLTFLRMVIEMINIHLFKGGFTQIGISCSLLAMISFSRYKDDELGNRMSELSSLLHEYSGDSGTRATIMTLQHFFVSHLRSPLRSTLPALESSMEAWSDKGDPHMILLSLSVMACTRLSLGQDMSELEAFCTDIPEEVNNWMDDARVGVIPVAVKQVARAIQGKTSWRSGDDVMSDAKHNSREYMEFIDLNATNPDRPRDIYWGLAMIPLYLYGHQEKAIEVGSKMMGSIDGLWSLRVSYLVKFYLSLSILTWHLDNPGHGNLDSRLEDVLKYKAEVDFARGSCDANYGMWSLLLEGLLCEIREDFHSSFLAYEAAVDHCEIHGWPLEEALALELQGDFLVRRGAKRPARGIIKEAIAAWTSIGATGKVSQLAEKHEWLLKTATTTRSHDIGCQTVDSFLGISRAPAPERIVDPPPTEEERKEHWLESNGASTGVQSLDISSVGLDIIDLSSILEFNQVMSSELQIDKLLTKMIEIILESCNGSDFAVIATDLEDVGFVITAAGDLEKGQKAFLDGLPFSEMEDKMAQQISHYAFRTREEVLVHNVLEDERFSNVSDAYQARHPLGRSVITLPIIQADAVLGVIHIEGKPNSFTQRNVVVLHLLCTQVGISLANALLFRKVRKISATNAAMIEAQKGALAQARSAEQKAKTAEAEANRNVKLKEDAAKAKSIFLANVSHDLRTPMNGVIGLSELLKGTSLDKEQDVYVESIRVCADTLLTLINDILDFSKLEAGKMKISTVPLNLKETIAEVVRALRYTHRDRGLETIEDLENVPPELVVLGDPVRLHQIFMNLLSNSYKFTPKGSVTVRAKVSRESKGKVRLECSVADTGIGIPEEHKSRLFRPFSQADSSTARSYGGSGLGLSICKAIIEDVLGGAIWLDSTPGVGTTVTFQLPFNKAFKEAVVKAPWSQIESKEPPKPVVRDLSMIPRHQIRVCIAEDNPINQKIAVQFVRVLGFESEAFSDGRQAVDALRQRSKEGRPFQVVLMDVQMPVLDGYNATREIRRDGDPNVNEALVIAMTASAIEGDRERCLEAGMNNYLAKPVRSGVLSEMLDQYLAPEPPQFKQRRQPVSRSSSESVTRDVGIATPVSSPSSFASPV